MIVQPILGSRLLALRIEKGMTQHELREKCHISVRTIQRIESGAVTPRASTVKILLEALGENPDVWFGSSNGIVENHFSIKSLRSMLLINSSEQDQKNALTPAWIGGIIYLLIGIIEIGVNVHTENHETSVSLLTVVIMVKLISIVSFFLFTRGFLSLSILFENQLLKIASYIAIAAITAIYSAEIIIIFSVSDYVEMIDTINVFSIVPFGAISFILGLGILGLQDGMGRIAKVAGRLEIVYGISYMTLIFSFVYVVLLPAVLIVEIVLLAKADQLVKEGQL
ncbi:helix-turn-helix domain-containing protein [Ekhidna sp.]|uniref:helix-turn-helix domain-containing protein n=1 Tax=Ekhidna sp. TaxID=2608089 RepID=UPI0035154897